MRTKTEIGDERWIVEMIETSAVEQLARKNGWDGNSEGLREHCEPENAAVHMTCDSLDEAVRHARQWLGMGKSFYGCVLIDHEVYEAAHDDRGRRVRGASWETQRTYEVALDDEVMEVDR